MKFSTLAALMATTSAVKITQSTAAKTTSSLVSKIQAKTTEAEPHYQITGTLTMEGEGAPANHEGPDLSDDMAEADHSPSVSAAAPHNPLANVEMVNQNFRVGGQLDVILNPGPIGDRFYIDLIQDDDNMIYFEVHGVASGEHGNCLYIHELKNGQWGNSVDYCVKDDTNTMDEIFEEGPEIQLQFLEDGVNMRVWGHLINEDMSDIFTITGSSAGKSTYNHAINWENYHKVLVYSGGNPHIIEAAME